MADRLIVQAAEHARKPMGPRKSAEWGERIRGELIDIIESVEAKTGAYAYALAGENQTLMMSDALRAAIKSHKMGDILYNAFGLLFSTQSTKENVTKSWTDTVGSFRGKRNDAYVLQDKAAILAFYIINHYDIPCLALAAEGRPIPDLDERAEEDLKLEAASSWYRLVDELAFRHIKQEHSLAVLGVEEDVPSIRAHTGLLLGALDQAMLRELLAGL
jgi:hypothetical protein